MARLTTGQLSLLGDLDRRTMTSRREAPSHNKVLGVNYRHPPVADLLRRGLVRKARVDAGGSDTADGVSLTAKGRAALQVERKRKRAAAASRRATAPTRKAAKKKAVKRNRSPAMVEREVLARIKAHAVRGFPLTTFDMHRTPHEAALKRLIAKKLVREDSTGALVAVVKRNASKSAKKNCGELTHAQIKRNFWKGI